MDRRTSLSIAALLVLVAGVVSGAVIYWLADDSQDASAYVVIGGTAYPVDPATSKAYTRQLERFGGKASVLFDDIDRWLASLWHGKRLGITIACMSACAALLLWLGARNSGPED
jgi:hypothetical protein